MSAGWEIMSGYNFILQQYCPQADTIRPCLAITGTAGRQADALLLQYHISGDIHALHIPRQEHSGSRRHGLWKDSCFEAFVGVKGSDRYWEINLSPNGDWNVYRFSGYRKEMTEESAFQALPCTLYETKHDIWLDVIVDLRAILREDHPIDLGVCCVLKHLNGDTTLWALSHPGPGADFHRRAGFMLAL